MPPFRQFQILDASRNNFFHMLNPYWCNLLSAMYLHFLHLFENAIMWQPYLLFLIYPWLLPVFHCCINHALIPWRIIWFVVAAIFCVVKSVLQSCIPIQTPSVHLAVQCLIRQILFVTLNVGTCGTHSLCVMHVKSLNNRQYEIIIRIKFYSTL